MRKALATVVILSVVVVMGVVVGVATMFFQMTTMGGTTTAPTSVCQGEPAPSVEVDAEDLPSGTQWTDRQLSGAAQILATGAELGVSERGQLIALMTARQESTLGEGNGVFKPNGDGDAGWFQQRTLPGWYGTLEQVNDPAIGARIFFKGADVTDPVPDAAGPVGYHIPGLLDIEGWEDMSLTEAAQAVQRSAYPDEYAKHEREMRELMAALAGVDVGDMQGSLVDSSMGCEGGLPPVEVGELPTQAQLVAPSVDYACPEGTVDLGPAEGGVQGKRVPIRLCSIPDTVCTGSDCRKGELGGRARGEVIVNSLVAPHFVSWLAGVREAGLDPIFSSSFRSWETQADISRGGTNSNAARPGWSNHQMGSAVDISGLPGRYNKHNCSGNTPDGSCRSSAPEWDTYWKVGVENGALFHDQEFWHLEWVITRAQERDVPFIAEEP